MQGSRATLGDFAFRPLPCDRGLPQRLSDHSSGTSPLAPQPVLGDCLDHSPTIARRLCVSTTCDWRLAYSWDILSRLDLATRLIPRLPASSYLAYNNRPATCDGTSSLKHPASTRLDFGWDQHQEASRREARRPQLQQILSDPILKLATRSESVPRASRVGKYEVKASATACINDET